MTAEKKKADRAALELKKKSTAPEAWFKEFRASEFSQYDAQGLPTHSAEGKELSKEILNKLGKEQKKQKGIYEKWLASQQVEETKE